MAAATLLLRASGCRDKGPPLQTAPSVLRIYFHGAGGEAAEPVPVLRRRMLPARADAAVRVRAAIAALRQGPTAAERKQGLYSSLPKTARLLDVTVARPYVFLDFGREMELLGGTAAVNAVLAQLAYTAAAVPGIKGVILEIEGQRTGTFSNPFTGEGLLFDSLHPKVDGAFAKSLAPPAALDLFIVTIPEAEEMWRLMGPQARRQYGSAARLDTSAFAEGLGSWRRYHLVRQTVVGNEAVLEIAGRQILEGMVEPNAHYVAHLHKEDGLWKWELPSPDAS